MTAIYNRLFQRLLDVKIKGNIDYDMSQKIYKSLKACKTPKVQAIVVSINSHGGSLTQAKNIVDALKQYAATKNAPIYCFAEDICLNSANYILTSGIKCYASRMSLLGDLSYTWSSIGLKRLAEKWNISQEYLYQGRNKIQFNPWDELRPESRDWMQNYLYDIEHELKVQIVRNRVNAFTFLKLNKEEIDKELLSCGLLDPEKAVKMGYLDGIKLKDELLEEQFSGVCVKEIEADRTRNWLLNLKETLSI